MLHMLLDYSLLFLNPLKAGHVLSLVVLQESLSGIFDTHRSGRLSYIYKAVVCMLSGTGLNQPSFHILDI